MKYNMLKCQIGINTIHLDLMFIFGPHINALEYTNSLCISMVLFVFLSVVK